MPVPRVPAQTQILSFAFILGGLMLFAYTQYTNVFPDPGRTEFGRPEPEGRPIGDTTFVLASGLLTTLGAVVLLARHSPAPRWGKAAALTVFGVTLFFFLVTNFSLFINGIAVATATERAIYFTASYLFHTGRLLSFAGVYLLFLFMLVLVTLLLASLGYLLVPHRFARALWNRREWAKNEAVHVASSLLLLLSLGVFFVYLLRLTVGANFAAMRAKGPLAQNVVALYYLFILLLFLLILTIAAHVFLVNWGTATPLDPRELLKSIANVSRVELSLLGATVGLNLLLLVSPTLVSASTLSTDPVFSLSPRGYSWFYFLILAPYLPYAFSQRRLKRMLRTGQAHDAPTAFSAHSLKLVQQFVIGLALVTIVAVAAKWDPLALMLAFSAWTAGVLLVHALRLEIVNGLVQPVLRGAAGIPLYFAFLAMALTTGLMMWGAGNTYEVLYYETTRSLQFTNEADLGQDIASRVGAVALLAGSLVLSLHLLARTLDVSRRFLGHYLWIFVVTTVAATTIFTVGVWTKGPQGLQDAYAGFAFRQYYGTEQWLVGLLLTSAVVALFWSLGRVFREILLRVAAPPPEAGAPGSPESGA